MIHSNQYTLSPDDSQQLNLPQQPTSQFASHTLSCTLQTFACKTEPELQASWCAETRL